MYHNMNFFIRNIQSHCYIQLISSLSSSLERERERKIFHMPLRGWKELNGKKFNNGTNIRFLTVSWAQKMSERGHMKGSRGDDFLKGYLIKQETSSSQAYSLTWIFMKLKRKKMKKISSGLPWQPGIWHIRTHTHTLTNLSHKTYMQKKFCITFLLIKLISFHWKNFINFFQIWIYFLLHIIDLKIGKFTALHFSKGR